ncbi:beta-glucosidase family protein [Nocardia alni]|uniref:beta-glucosidase family protein n=1 Tax=Nocardia alni TaxID=2815723 RepID=UPI0020B24709|nr:glycoside hydrolase family 3 C-terminal domain-containing protein [Nocardia alni]
MDDRIEELSAKLDLPGKLRLISGASMFRMAGDPALGLAEMPVSDGPTGVRGERWDERDPSVSLPSGTALAATWDRELLGEIGALIAAEARRKNVYAVLGPTVNLHRSPLGGRHFECFSEDPMLTGEMAEAYVRAVQAHGVAACPKHYVANDSETDRFTVDVRADDRVLRELYLYPFERSVGAGAWMLMASYNSVDGVTMTENPLLDEPLKGSWGFDGVVVSDWTAIRSTDGAAASTDLCMPGPPMLWGEPLAEAVRAGRVPEAAIDEKVRRILRFATRVGALDGSPRAAPEFTDDQARELVRRAAAEAMVLVRNEGVLPLPGHTSGSAGAAEPVEQPRGRTDSSPSDSAGRNVSSRSSESAASSGPTIALLGPGAAEPRFMGGGSATVIPARTTTPLEGLGAVLPVTHTPGVWLSDNLTPVPLALLTDPETGEEGLSLRYLDGDTVIATQHRTAASLVLFGDPASERASRIELRARVRADATGEWQLGVGAAGRVRLDIDGETVAEGTPANDSADPIAALLDPPQLSVTRTLAVGQEVDVRVTISDLTPIPGLGVFLGVTLGVTRPRRTDDEEFAAAVELARTSEVAVVVVGTSEQIESEGFDRTTLRLPGRQDDLVAAVAAVNSRTVVVVNSGAPVEMPWREEVAAVLLSWFPGQEFGAALADVLTGAREPGGRLPTTWPAEMADVPVLDVTPDADGALVYREGVHIGYRAWLRADVRPAYPFGHGLGYTTWEMDDLTVQGRTAAVTVRNTGDRAGKHVVQAYLSREHSAIDRPVRWLAAFATLTLEPGQSRRVQIPLPQRAFEHWTSDGWAVEPGTFTLHVGGSVEDLPLTAEVG